MNKEFWDNRYAADEYVFGIEPNVYFKSVIDKLPVGRLLVPGAGEGRDAVYAARLGWDVTCVDMSESGRNKATLLAEQAEVSLRYIVGSIQEVNFAPGTFDAIGSIFFHLPEPVRKEFHHKAIDWLKPGGHFFTELFTPAQLGNTSGGPKDIAMLSTSLVLATDLAALMTIENYETETSLLEGGGHVGKANVVRFAGIKN